MFVLWLIGLERQTIWIGQWDYPGRPENVVLICSQVPHVWYTNRLFFADKPNSIVSVRRHSFILAWLGRTWLRLFTKQPTERALVSWWLLHLWTTYPTCSATKFIGCHLQSTWTEWFPAQMWNEDWPWWKWVNNVGGLFLLLWWRTINQFNDFCELGPITC